MSVTPGTSLEDQPVAIRVTGLPPGRLARVVLRSTDTAGVKWASAATFRADGHGTIDLARALPISASYEGAWGMGLFATLLPVAADRRVHYSWGSGSDEFRVSATSGGKVVATGSFERQVGRLAVVRLQGRQGLVGEYVAPLAATGQAPVLVFGGSEGGLDTVDIAVALAARGHPALALAYFKEPGLPRTLQRIPLEYFARALRWLGSRPHVDRSKLVVLGISRGSEAAELLGVHYPSLVHGVIASVPSDVVYCGLTADERCGGSAWTFRGRPLPYSLEFGNPKPDDVPAAVIPVERIRGPILFVCAGRDWVWPSCRFAQAMVARLASRHSPDRRELAVYPAAGHDMGLLAPDEPGISFLDQSPQPDEQAREQVWPRVLGFLAAL